MTDTYDGFHVERDPGSGIATITLDVPEKMNRVSMPARDQLAAVFGELGGDDAVRVIVVGGAGEKAFTAGGDIPGFMAYASLAEIVNIEVGWMPGVTSAG